MKRVLVTEELHPRGMAILDAAPDVEIVRVDDIEPDTLRNAVKDVDGIVVRSAILTTNILEAASRLQVVSRHGVGCDNVDVAHLSARGIPMAIAAGANALSVAEHTLGLMLTCARDLVQQDALVKAGRWAERNSFRACDLHGAKVVVLGFGRVGRRVAPLLKAMGMDVVVADIALDDALAGQLGCRGVTDFRPELAGADFLTLHVPLDDSTRHIISTAELAAMNKGGIVINCARGGVVDNDALIAALESGHIRAAGVDVMPVEPPEPNHPLILRHDVVMTPHNGAGATSSVIAMSEMSAQNVLNVFAGTLTDDCTFNLKALQDHAGQ